jgi:hypothetical protein
MPFIVLILVLFCVLPSRAQAQLPPVLSPRDSVSLSLDTNRITVNYGRPSMRGRKIMGGLVPWGKVWRTGANQATHLKTTFDMMLGDAPVPQGVYTLWSLPDPTGWKIIINNQTGQWGTQYDERQDRARIPAKVENMRAPVDTFLITLERTGTASGRLRLRWESTMVTVPFVKNDRIQPVSPLDSSELVLAGKTIKIRYSKPYRRGRDIWGVLVPMDSLWRTGADNVTALITEADLRVEGGVIPRGAYALYSIPTERGMTLIVNRQRIGTLPDHDAALDVARFPMTMEHVNKRIDPLKIWFERQGPRSCTLKLGWVDRVYSAVINSP